MGRRPAAWVYKCSAKGDGSKNGYSWTDPGYGYLRRAARRAEGFGGEDWIRSPLSWQNLRACRAGDLIFCHQTDARGLVGLTVANSGGYNDPEGERPDRFTKLDLGPVRIRFGATVTIDAIRERVGDLDAYRPGKSQSTFLAIEARVAPGLVRLCEDLNPRYAKGINDLVNGAAASISRTAGEGVLQTRVRLDDPVRREMTIEAFERKAAWAREARWVYGHCCMVPGCDFELTKEDGTEFIEVHHILPMCDGGGNEIRNLSVLCPNHHRAVHYGHPLHREELRRGIRKEQDTRLKRRQLLA